MSEEYWFNEIQHLIAEISRRKIKLSEFSEKELQRLYDESKIKIEQIRKSERQKCGKEKQVLRDTISDRIRFEKEQEKEIENLRKQIEGISEKQAEIIADRVSYHISRIKKEVEKRIESAKACCPKLDCDENDPRTLCHWCLMVREFKDILKLLEAKVK